VPQINEVNIRVRFCDCARVKTAPLREKRPSKTALPENDSRAAHVFIKVIIGFIKIIKVQWPFDHCTGY